jgi:hypothetical protein
VCHDISLYALRDEYHVDLQKGLHQPEALARANNSARTINGKLKVPRGRFGFVYGIFTSANPLGSDAKKTCTVKHEPTSSPRQFRRDALLLPTAFLGSNWQTNALERHETRRVYGPEVPLAITPGNVTAKFRLSDKGRRCLLPKTIFGKAILGQVDEYCRIRKRNWTLLHDPLAVPAPFRAFNESRAR